MSLLFFFGGLLLVTGLQAVAAGGPAQQALTVAQDGVDPALRGHIVSIYGTGTPADIHTWWVIFYDPAAASGGRAVKVENGQIVRTYEAKPGVVYSQALTFPPEAVHGVGQALRAAQDYAGRQALAYDHVRALLRMPPDGGPLRWRIQLLDGATSRGFVFVDPASGAFAMYAPPSAAPAGGPSGDSVEANANAAGTDIKKTFLGIGGDLQQFFTGERTVDQ